MTEHPPFDEHGDRLRRALQAEAEAVTPDPDGLERIRTRIGGHERRFGWLTVPWLRPLAAAGAAVAIATVAVTATPAIEGFVSASHESASDQDGGNRSTPTNGPGAPGVHGRPLDTTSGPGGLPQTTPGQTPVVPIRGTCPPGQVQVLVPAKVPRQIPHILPSTNTCRPATPASTPPVNPTTPITTPTPPITSGSPSQQPSNVPTP